MKKKLQKFIKNKDMFGHVPQLNFSKDTPTHNTLLGGIISIIVYISLFDIILNMFLTMAFRNNSTISRYTASYDVESNGGVSLNSTSLVPYFVLRKQTANDGPIYLGESSSSYLDIYFA